MSEQSSPNLWRSSSIIYRCGQVYLARSLEEIGIGRGASQMVPLIVRFPGITQDRIACILTLDKGAIARALAQLEGEGYVKRTPDESDGRVNRVYPTPKLNDHLEFINKTMDGWYDIVLEGVEESERKLVLRALEKMAENAKNHVTKDK